MRYGTIGSGSIVDLFIESSKQVDDVSCEIVYSRSLKKAQAFALKHDVKLYCDDLDELFNSSFIDTVYIASPNSCHYPQAKRALLAGKNVILEKPVCATVLEYKDLMNIANDNGVFIVEAITNIHSDSMKFIQEKLPILGKIQLINANFSQYSSRYDDYKKGIVANVFDPKMQGGALVDIGIYNLYICYYLFNKPDSYQYYANKGFNGIDTSGVLILQYPSFIATLCGAKDCYAPYSFLIQGSNATLLIDQGSSGRCHHVALMQKGEIIEEFTQDDYHMTFEIQDFKNAFASSDIETINQWNQYTLDVLTIMENCRLLANIEY